MLVWRVRQLRDEPQRVVRGGESNDGRVEVENHAIRRGRIVAARAGDRQGCGGESADAHHGAVQTNAHAAHGDDLAHSRTISRRVIEVNTARADRTSKLSERGTNSRR